MMESCILIVEDELLIAETLRSILTRAGYTNILMAENVTSALVVLNVSEVTLVITDIAMGEERTGIDLGVILNERYRIPFIYVTSHASADIVHKAKYTEPAAYIVKPFKKEDVLVALELALFKADSKTDSGELIVKEGRSVVRMFFRDIKWIEADGNYTTIYLSGDNKRSVIRQSLSTLQEQLPEEDFIRIHKSYVVNKKYIHQIKAGAIYVEDRELPVGRSYQHIVVKLFK